MMPFAPFSWPFLAGAMPPQTPFFLASPSSTACLMPGGACVTMTPVQMIPVQVHPVPVRGDVACEAALMGLQQSERRELPRNESGGAAGPVPRRSGLRFVGPTRQPEELHQGEGDGVTTLSINHIPIDLGRQQLLALLDETGFGGRYDYFYLPCNYREGTNRGHAFVNLCTPDDARRFFAAWHGARLFSGEAKVDGSLLSISVGTEQGFESCAARWTAIKMRRLKNADFLPFIRTIQ